MEQRKEEKWGKGVYNVCIGIVHKSLLSQLHLKKKSLQTTNNLSANIRGFKENLFYLNDTMYIMC